MTDELTDWAIKNPNFVLAIQTSQHILQIESPINQIVILVCLNNETVGAVKVSRENIGKLTEQTKINALLQVMSTLEIPFKMLEKYGNLKAKDINYGQEEANRRQS